MRSAYLSPGYWGSHDLTDAVFVPDPDGSTRRVYLTGDTGLLLPDGCLIHLGRKDTQLKIRGHRVEPQEVERAVLGLPQVRDAAVVADQGPGGHRRLVAHVVPASPGTLQANDLRRSLRATLPDFMVPSVFVVRDELPQLSGGKVDRVRLSAERQELEPEAPRNDIEARLAGIWERILRVTPIGRSDDFFALGGDSLAAEQLGVELGIAFGMDLPSSVLLEAPTIAGLAEVLKRGRQPAAIVALRTEGSRTPFFCIHGIGGDILPLQALVKHLGEDQPIYGLRAEDGDVNRLSIEAIAAHYAEAIEQIQPEGPYALGGFSFGGTVAFELARQFVVRGKTVDLLVLLDTYGPDYRLLPVSKRLGVHLKTFAKAARGRRLPYLQARTRRLRKMARVRLSYLVEDLRAALRRWVAGRKPDTLRAAHWLALRNYVPGPYAGKIHLFRARDEVDVWYPDPVLGWGRLAAGGIEVHLVPGEHLTFMKEPHTSAWAGTLCELLETVNREARDDEAVALSAPMPIGIDAHDVYLLSSPSPAATLRRPIEGGGA